MMKKPCVITLKREGYDPFIDYLKGICIILVVLTHCIPDIEKEVAFVVWGMPAVPMFLVLQVFHAYKKGVNEARVQWKKVWKRVVKPFIVVEALAICFIFLSQIVKGQPMENVVTTLISIITTGGLGPGAYYPWIYVQFAVLLPLMSWVFRRLSGTALLMFFILASQMLEISCNLASVDDDVNKLLFFRYFFLIYLGYILVEKGCVINKCTMAASFISIISLLCFYYGDVNCYPWFYKSVWGDNRCHWICYIYIVFPYLYAIRFLYVKTSAAIKEYIKTIGRYSYDIFIFQLMYFWIEDTIFRFMGISLHDSMTVSIANMFISMILCVVPVVWLKQRK